MNRRGFFGRLAALVGLAAVAGGTKRDAAPELPTPPHDDKAALEVYREFYPLYTTLPGTRRDFVEELVKYRQGSSAAIPPEQRG